MYSAIRRFLIIFLSISVAVLFSVAAATVFLTENRLVYANVTGDMTLESITANSSLKYNNASFKNFFGVKADEIESYSTNGGERVNGANIYSLANAFDLNDTGTYWCSQEATSEDFKNHIVVNFKNTLPLRSIRYAGAWFGDKFSGYPKVLKVYAARGNEDFVQVGVCESTPSKGFSQNVVFTLPRTVECNKVKLEFAEVSQFNSSLFGNTAVAVAGGISFFKSDDGYTQTVKPSGNLASTDFLVSNSVTAEEMKIRANGGEREGFELLKAFDKNTKSFWQSESYNTDIFKNKIIVNLEKEFNLSSVVWGCSYYTRNGVRNFSGFPTQMNVTATKEDGTQTKYAFYGTPAGDWTMGEFTFPEVVRCKKLELEFTEVTVFGEIAGGTPIVACSEIFLIKSANESLGETLEKVNGIFSDYAQYEVKEEYTLEKLSALREEAKASVSYEKVLKPILDRAEAILTGAMKKDVYREFSTDPDAKNVIEQNGDLVNYCRNTLQHSSFGTNRQVIGIGGTTGETITIYVEAGEDDPLPSVAFTQIYGAWNSWMRTFTLQRGKNEIVFPNFKANGSYKRAIAAGGPIHVINPYTPEQQSSNVKMYIEGGYLYPVFHDGDDEGTFRVILKDFYERLSDPNDSSITVDAFEAVTGNAILSCTATLAYNSYVRGGSSPQYNIDKWRKYTMDTLAFGGVEFDPSKPHYDYRNNFIKANYRIVQPYAGMYAFAHTEHIGIIDTATFGAMVQKWTLGWAFAHEFGHMLDNMRMKQPETTNNMWAIFNIYMVDGRFNDRINVSNVSKNLASDFSAKVGKYHGNGNDNCDFWWILEGGHSGYWAKLQQLYCFETSGANITDATEKLCYFSSLATGDDVTAYFERWGFYFKNSKFNADNRFAYSKTSQEFKNAMSAAKSSGRISSGESKKFWYVNNDQYRYTRQHGGTLSADWASCYDLSQTVKINDVMGGAGSYTLLLPAPQSAESHLCYEVQSFIDGAWKVLGVTYSTSFTDTYDYGAGVTPQYRVYAYDRMFNRTGDPAVKVPEAETQTDVCRIGEVKYNSLKEAVTAATAGDTIYLLKDFSDGGIVINKNLTIIPDTDIFTGGRAVTITKNAAGHLFNISATVTFGSATNKNVPISSPIILDGNSFTQNGSLIYTGGGRVTLNNVTLQNNINTSQGGAINAVYGSHVYFNDCIIQNNSASNGGGMLVSGAVNIYLRGLSVLNNTASGNGGGICELEHQGNSSVNNGTKIDGAFTRLIISGNRAVNGGGFYTQNNAQLYSAQIVDNVATNGGGIYTDMVDNSSRNIQLIGCTVRGNEATLGDAIYMYRGKTTLNGGKVSGIIYKVYDKSPAAVFALESALPDLSEAEIILSKAIPAEGLILCESVKGMSAEIIIEAAPSYNVANGHAQFESGVGVKVYPTEASVTINYGSGSFTATVLWGNYKLPERFENLPEGKYINKYVINGIDYNVGDTVAVSGDFTAVAEVLDYYEVKLIYGDYSETLLMRQNVTYYLPMKTPSGEVVFGWDCSNGKYYAYAEGVVIVGNTSFKAVIKRLHTVITVVEGAKSESKYEYGGSVTLPTPSVIFGKAFSHWDIDGKKYQANQTVKVTGDFVATAVYTNSWRITTIIEDEEVTKIYPNGAIIVLEGLPSSLGREFKCWSINGSKYYAGSSYTVTGDSEIIAVFSQLDASATITVTVVVNKGAIAGNEEIVENETKQLSYKFNAKHEFTKPEVNEGNEFLYWDVNGVKYTAGSQIAVTEPFTAIAVVTQIPSDDQPKESFTVTVKDYVNGVFVTTEYEYSSSTSVCLAKPSDIPEDKEFLHWLVDGEKHEAGTFITVDADTRIEAVYKTVEKPVLPPDGSDDGDDSDDNIGGGSNAGLIAGVIVGVAAAVSAGLAVTVIVLKKKGILFKSKNTYDEE